jgi:hypothetical protein
VARTVRCLTDPDESPPSTRLAAAVRGQVVRLGCSLTQPTEFDMSRRESNRESYMGWYKDSIGIYEMFGAVGQKVRYNQYELDGRLRG